MHAGTAMVERRTLEVEGHDVVFFLSFTLLLGK